MPAWLTSDSYESWCYLFLKLTRSIRSPSKLKANGLNPTALTVSIVGDGLVNENTKIKIMSAYEGSKMQEIDEDNKRHERIAKKNIVQNDISPDNETAGYSDIERVKAFVEIFEKANQLNVRSFIQWCDKEDWFFVKPIKTPKLKA